MKKIFSIFLSIVTVFTMCFSYSVNAFAENIPLGDGIYGTFDETTETLTVMTEGDESKIYNIPDYDAGSAPSFAGIAEEIKTIKVDGEVDQIGSYAFYNCKNLEQILIYNNACTLNDNCIPENKEITVYGQAASAATFFAIRNGYQRGTLYLVTYISLNRQSLSSILYPEGTPLSELYTPDFTEGYVQPAMMIDGIYSHRSSMNIWSPTPTPSGDTLTSSIVYNELYISEECTFEDNIVDATCTAKGYTSHVCTVCGFEYTDKETEMLPHDFGTDGNEKNCLVCGTENPNYTDPGNTTTTAATTTVATTATTAATTTQPAPQQPDQQPSLPSLSTTQYEKQTTKVNKVSKPKKTSIKKLKKGKKQFKVTWKKISGVTGYQIQYSTSPKFYKSKTKTVTVKGASKTSKTIKKLKSKKKYYVRVRTYKKTKVNGKVKTTFSSYSKVKTIRVK